MSNILSSVEGGIIGVGVGTGVAAAVEPVVEPAKQEVWDNNPYRILDPALLAELVTQALVEYAPAAAQAKRSGFDGNKFRAMVEATFRAPGTAEALELWRRDRIDKEQMRHALHKAGLETQWIEPVLDLFSERLDPAVIAVAIQRTVMANPDILPNQPSTAGSNVPPMPQVGLDPLKEAKASGIDKERLSALTRIVGLPASADLAARMHFRKIITEGAYNQAILEGNTRGEWAPYLLDGFREIPTAHDGIEGRLRGWIDDAEMYAQTARHGMSQADTDLLFKITGRPLSFHQVFIGERRGGVYDGPTDAIDPAFLKALRESNIRPEWYNIAWAQRYSYPSAFVLRALTEAGDLTQAEAHEILLFTGWPPVLAEKVSTRWAGGVGAAVDPNVKKAQEQLRTTTHRSFVASEITEADVTAVFDQLAIPAAARPEIIGLWMAERDMTRKQLTPTQLKKAFSEALIDPATGTAWTRFDVLNRLTALGYSFEDAETFLDL